MKTPKNNHTDNRRHEPKILNDDAIQNNEAAQRNTNFKHNKVNQNPQAGQKHTLGTNIEYEDEADQNEDFALCPMCRLAVDEGICCEKCELWYQFQREHIDEADQRIYENTDLNYTCLACGFNQRCDGIDYSLIIDEKHIHKSNPASNPNETVHHNLDRDETHRKEGHEPSPVPNPSVNLEINTPKETQSNKPNMVAPSDAKSNVLSPVENSTQKNKHPNWRTK